MANILKIVNDGLCAGCGICQNICPNKAISMKIRDAVFVPQINTDLCKASKGCNLCYKVCAGKGLDSQKISRNIFANSNCKIDFYIGTFMASYAGYSLDNDIRMHSASGGVLSSFLIYLIKKQIISGAIITRFSDKDPLFPEVFLATDSDDVLKGKSSKYCPVSLHGIKEMINRIDGKVVIVGLPCHINSLRNMMEVDSLFSRKIYALFALYCSGTKTFRSQEFIKKFFLHSTEIRKFAYRDDGCMGFLKVLHQNGVEVKIPYKKYYLSMRGFFTPYRCVYCSDHFGELGDVSFGDIQVDDYEKDLVGHSSIIFRKKQLLDDFRAAIHDKYIYAEEIDSETIIRSQVYVKRHKKGYGIAAAIWFNKLMNKPLPLMPGLAIDKIPVKYKLRHIRNCLFRWIGKRACLWFLIPLLDAVGNIISRNK